MKNGCINLIKKKWSREDQAVFLIRLGRLLQEGYALNDALRFLMFQFPERMRGELHEFFIRKLQAGEPFFKILSSCCFQSTAISFCYFGEHNGQLANMLKTAGDILQNHLKLKKKLFRLLSYPFFLLFFTLIILVLFQVIVLPQFQSFFNSYAIQASGLLRFLFWLNEHPYAIMYCLLVTGLFLLLFYRFFWYPRSSFQKQMLLSRLPMIGQLFRLWNTYYFSFHLGQLLKSGLSLGDCLELLADDPEKRDLKHAILIINRALLTGKEFPRAVSTIPFWQKELEAIIHHGQLYGTLDRELINYSKFCFELMMERIARLIRILQPALLSLIGFLIIYLYLSIFLPTFQLIENI